MNDEPVRGRGPDPRLLALSGLESMRAAWVRRVLGPPIHHLVGLRPVTIGSAAVSFTMPTSPRLCSDADIFYAGMAPALIAAALATMVLILLVRSGLPGCAMAESSLPRRALEAEHREETR